MSTLSSAPGKQVVVAQTELKAGALHLPEVLMQAITHIAPAIGLITSVLAITQNAGKTAPLAFLIAFVLMLLLGVGLVELARHLPSAGGYYTYVSRTVSARAGFLTTWMYFLYDPVGGLLNFAIMGWILQAVLKAEWNVVFPWWIFMILATAILTFLTYVGVELSGRSMVVLGIFEMVVVVLLTFTGLVHPGSGGVNLGGFNPGNSISANGLFLGVVFCIFAFTGFESVAPMAEESANPRRTLPRAIIWSIVIMGLFYTLCTWGILIGWGTNDLQSFNATSTSVSGNPVLPLAKHLWGGAWILVLIAMLNSVLAVSIACQNAVTRVYFAMGRTGVLPRALAKVHPRFKTPTNAIWFQTAINLVVGLGLGFWIGPYNEWALLAIVLTLAMILVLSLIHI